MAYMAPATGMSGLYLAIDAVEAVVAAAAGAPSSIGSATTSRHCPGERCAPGRRIICSGGDL